VHYLESKLGLELILKYSAGLDYTPPQTRGCSEITPWLGCSSTAAALVMHHENLPKSVGNSYRRVAAR